MKVSEAIARAVALESDGAPVFSLIGDANLPMIGALDRFTDVPLRFARHEMAAVAMADGYAQATGGTGLASVTSGPGLTHAATSLLGASRMRTPLVVLTGDTPMQRPAGLQAMQDFDQRRFADACEVGFQDLRSPASLADDFLSAFHQARTRRIPVLLNAPLDVQAVQLPDGWSYDPTQARLSGTRRRASRATRRCGVSWRSPRTRNGRWSWPAAARCAPAPVRSCNASPSRSAPSSARRCWPRACSTAIPGLSASSAVSADRLRSS